MRRIDWGFLIIMGTLLSCLWLVDARLDAVEAKPEQYRTITVLVGQGCVGAQGPNGILVGIDEDEFDHCDAIDVHEVAVSQ